MFDKLKQQIQKQAPITDADLEIFFKSLQVRNIKKKKNILSEGELANNMYFVNVGILRYYSYNSQGDEITTDLIAEHNWFGDARAFLGNTRATINIEAIEDCQIFVLNKVDLERFYDELPYFERAVRKIMEYYFVKAIELRNKVNRAGYSANERYMEFINTHPKIVNKIPSVYLASYLGITPETLSRLRSQKLKKAVS